jgi:hypothetical protein
MKVSIIGGVVMLVILGALYVLTGNNSKSEAPAEQAAPATESNSAFKL